MTLCTLLQRRNARSALPAQRFGADCRARANTGYSVTSSQIAKELADAASGIERLQQSPAAKLSSSSLMTAIVQSSVDARAEDWALLSDARDALSRSIGRTDGIVQRGQGLIVNGSGCRERLRARDRRYVANGGRAWGDRLPSTG